MTGAIKTPRVSLSALVGLTFLKEKSGASRLEQPRNKAEARKRLFKAYEDRAIIDQEIVLLGSFLCRDAADIKPRKIQL